MQSIHYASETILTGTDIAHAMLTYAQALAENDKSDTVVIPVYRPDGTRGEAEFLIGPASQLVAESVESTAPELIDTDLVAQLTASASALGTPRPQPVDAADVAGYPEFDQP